MIKNGKPQAERAETMEAMQIAKRYVEVMNDDGDDDALQRLTAEFGGVFENTGGNVMVGTIQISKDSSLHLCLEAAVLFTESDDDEIGDTLAAYALENYQYEMMVA